MKLFSHSIPNGREENSWFVSLLLFFPFFDPFFILCPSSPQVLRKNLLPLWYSIFSLSPSPIVPFFSSPEADPYLMSPPAKSPLMGS
ncbi:hypothetical protein NPIL_535651 [Nephila pilipes]|uniref:Uncharacterized protein n=1 Tax=Nephila pilipes TaxID=299642 RepID=A0A8X6NW59_NEPPI|nr:hypothetical protein NPIL_535651 [Nephila pilipes]